jgi:hypothetical protein
VIVNMHGGTTIKIEFVMSHCLLTQSVLTEIFTLEIRNFEICFKFRFKKKRSVSLTFKYVIRVLTITKNRPTLPSRQ